MTSELHIYVRSRVRGCGHVSAYVYLTHERAERYNWLEAMTSALWLVHMACHVGTSKYSRDAHKDRVLQLHYIFVVAMYMEECIVFRFDNLVIHEIQ